MGYIIRAMSKKEIDIALDLARIEGWNPGIYDADSFYSADPSGFFIGLLDNIPVSCISAVKYQNGFGFIGFYIVKKEYRGKGYGIKIWNKALEYLSGRNIGLDGVVSQQENYKKSGFKLAYRNIRFAKKSIKTNHRFRKVTQISKIPFQRLADYDSSIFPSQRYDFLKLWTTQPESHALCYRENYKILGYGVIRKCINGYKIGPLFADNPMIAEKIFLALNESIKEETVFLDVPEINIDGTKLAEKYNMSLVFETARMYRKKCPKEPIEKVFGVTSFELG